MDLRLLLAVIFLVAAFIFWITAWRRRDQPVSLTAFRCSCLFEVAGLVALLCWRLTT